ncbi:MAG: Rnf-Nqr domain containing protein [Pseudomonadota bacterium]
MSELIVILVGTIFVNNIVMERLVGVGPFVGASRRIDAAATMSLATLLVVTLSTTAAALVYQFVLIPLELDYLRTLSAVVVIGASIKLAQIATRRLRPMLHEAIRTYLPLVATNSAILGVALLSMEEVETFFDAVIYGFGSAVGFVAVLVLMAGIRERLEAADVPMPFRGAAIVLLTAGIMSLAFLGFAGMARP